MSKLSVGITATCETAELWAAERPAVPARLNIHFLWTHHFLHLVLHWFCLLWAEMRRWQNMLFWHMYASLTSWNNKYTACLHRDNGWFLKCTYIFYSLIIADWLYISLLKFCISSKVFSHCDSQSNKIMIIGFINISFIALWVKFTCSLMNWWDLNESHISYMWENQMFSSGISIYSYNSYTWFYLKCGKTLGIERK